jgi:hypothetical protein
MSNTPICPTHQKPMKAGRGNYYCPTRTGTAPDGSSIFCEHRVAFPKPTVAAAVRPVADSAPASVSDRAAALSFAARIYQGSGNVEDALIAASLALQFLRG